MPTAAQTAAAAANRRNLLPIKTEIPLHTTEMADPSPSSVPGGPIRIDGSEHDAALSKSEVLTRAELLDRRARRVKQLVRIYRDQYWNLMEELKLKHRQYYWEYGKSPFVEEEENGDCIGENGYGSNGGNNFGNGGFAGRCGMHGCKAKAMALTKFCHMHILSDSKQVLYKACNFPIKSSATGPILCGKPILRSTIPSYCPVHYQKAEKHTASALKKAGLNVSSTSKLAPKFHCIIEEYVREIKNKRKAARKANFGNVEIKKEINS